MREKPELTFETIKRMEDMTWFTHARIFDDLLVVAQKETACYIWKTIKGLVVFDGIWPDPKVYEEILNAIKEAGWEQEKICKFVMTHGHIDHVGCGRYLAEYHHAETYLSKEDDRMKKANQMIGKNLQSTTGCREETRLTVEIRESKSFRLRGIPKDA